MVVNQSPNQDRSRRRREALLRAAIELVAEGGAKAVTHRAVAARAGVPLAATTYYFNSIQELTEEALRLHVAERVAEVQDLADAVSAGGRSAQWVAEQAAETLVARPTGRVVAQFQLYLDAARNPALRPAVADALDAFERFAAGVLAQLGAREPDRAARTFIALFDGFALHRVARPLPPGEETQALVAAMRALFLEQTTDPEQATGSSIPPGSGGGRRPRSS